MNFTEYINEGSQGQKRLKRKADALEKQHDQAMDRELIADRHPRKPPVKGEVPLKALTGDAYKKKMAAFKAERRKEVDSDARNTGVKIRKAFGAHTKSKNLGTGGNKEYEARMARKRDMHAHESMKHVHENQQKERREEDKKIKDDARKGIRTALNRVIHIKGDNKKRTDIARRTARNQKVELSTANKEAVGSIKNRTTAIKLTAKQKELQIAKQEAHRLSRISGESSGRLRGARRDLAAASRNA